MELELIESDSHRDLHQAELTLKQVREEIEKVKNPHKVADGVNLIYSEHLCFEKARQDILKAIEVKE